MSSSASELNSLGSTTTIDLYKRSIKKEASDGHYVISSKLFTALWGALAILFCDLCLTFRESNPGGKLIGLSLLWNHPWNIPGRILYEMGERFCCVYGCTSVSGFDLGDPFSEWRRPLRNGMGHRLSLVQCHRLSFRYAFWHASSGREEIKALPN